MLSINFCVELGIDLDGMFSIQVDIGLIVYLLEGYVLCVYMLLYNDVLANFFLLYKDEKANVHKFT